MPDTTLMDTYTPNNLVAGTEVVIMKKLATILKGQVLKVGAILGKITIGAATKAAAGAGTDGANTGNGTLTMDATTPILAGAKPGVYKVKVIRAAIASPAMAAIGQLIDPGGDVLAVFDIIGSGGTTVANQVKFNIKEGSTGFAITDGFTITIAAGSGKYVLVDSSAVDGSAVAELVLPDAVDATADDVNVTAYQTGCFNRNALIVAEGDTVDAHEAELRRSGIFLKDNIAY
jgi:hypothetical protein